MPILSESLNGIFSNCTVIAAVLFDLNSPHPTFIKFFAAQERCRILIRSNLEVAVVWVYVFERRSKRVVCVCCTREKFFYIYPKNFCAVE